jgi:FtsP/CotA-like multicopper oxidase with cupredoxin domain
MSVANRTLRLERTNGAWTVNGTTWDKIVASNYQFVEAAPTVGTVETWTIENKSGGWFHPLHIHLVDFKVLSRNGGPAMPHEAGPKDVVYTGENEIIKLLVRFDSLGKYMVHCHNLVHEDHDMMTQFEVVGPNGEKGDDPMYAAVARDMEFEATDVL